MSIVSTGTFLLTVIVALPLDTSSYVAVISVVPTPKISSIPSFIVATLVSDDVQFASAVTTDFSPVEYRASAINLALSVEKSFTFDKRTSTTVEFSVPVLVPFSLSGLGCVPASPFPPLD